MYAGEDYPTTNFAIGVSGRMSNVNPSLYKAGSTVAEHISAYAVDPAGRRSFISTGFVKGLMPLGGDTGSSPRYYVEVWRYETFIDFKSFGGFPSSGVSGYWIWRGGLDYLGHRIWYARPDAAASVGNWLPFDVAPQIMAEGESLNNCNDMYGWFQRLSVTDTNGYTHLWDAAVDYIDPPYQPPLHPFYVQHVYDYWGYPVPYEFCIKSVRYYHSEVCPT